MFVSQVVCLEARTTLTAHWKSGVPSVCSSALGCAVARRGLEAREGFPFLTQSLWLWKQTQEEILLPHRHCTSPYSEGCAVGWAAAEGAAGRSRHCFLQVTGEGWDPWACPRGFVTAQIQCPAWGLRNRFHVFYWLLQLPFVVLLGSSNRAIAALISTWVFCSLVCFLPSSRNIFIFSHEKEKKRSRQSLVHYFYEGRIFIRV